jgi:predicted PurR-regulated permease PerM
MRLEPQADLARIFLFILIVAILIAASLWTLLPFLGSLVWAATIVVATWPMLLSIQRLFGQRRSLATACMALIMLAVFILPFGLAAATLLDGFEHGAKLVRTLMNHGVQPPPDWVVRIPWVGAKIADRWQELAAGGPDAVAKLLRPYMSVAATKALAATGGIGLMVLHFFVTVIIACVLYVRGEMAAEGVLMFARRLGGERGERSVHLAGQAVRGVALGVVITAVVQSLLAGVGLWIAGVPRPGLLLAATFILCVAQLGPLLVLGPAVCWLYWSGDATAGTVLLVISIFVGTIDNFLKPVLIRKGVDLPLPLIIVGVIGGLIGFGVLGLFIGPVILAVTFTLLQQWVKDMPPQTQ